MCPEESLSVPRSSIGVQRLQIPDSGVGICNPYNSQIQLHYLIGRTFGFQWKAFVTFGLIRPTKVHYRFIPGELECQWPECRQFHIPWPETDTERRATGCYGNG